MAQEVGALAQSALDYVLDGDVELRRIEQALAAAEREERYEDLANLYQRYDEIGGYTSRARAPSCWPASASASRSSRRAWPTSRAAGACASTSHRR